MGRSKEFDESEVLQKAMELFWKQGYEKTSMRDLVTHMGIHRKSIYDTFGDKHSLYLKAVEYYSEFSSTKFRDKIQSAKNSIQAIQYIFDYIIEGQGDNHLGCLFVNAATEFGTSDNDILKKTDYAFIQEEKIIENIIQKGQDSGEISMKYSVELLGEILHNSFVGLRVLVKTSTSKVKMYNTANFFLDLMRE